MPKPTTQLAAYKLESFERGVAEAAHRYIWPGQPFDGERWVLVDKQHELQPYVADVLDTVQQLWDERDFHTARRFVGDMRDGDSFPPLLVDSYDKQVRDGCHRLFALWMSCMKRFWVINLQDQPDFRTIQPQGFVQPVSPRIHARAHSDDHAVELGNIDVTAYFEYLPWEGWLALRKCDWGGDYPADEVILAYKDGPAKPLFDYLEIVRGQGRDDMGFECYVNEQEALAWLQACRPDVYTELMRGEVAR